MTPTLEGILQAVLLAGMASVIVLLIVQGRRGSEAGRIRREVEELRRELAREVGSIREQSRASFDHTAQTLAQELKASREEVGRLSSGLREEIDRKLGETVSKNLESFAAVTQKLGDLHKATGQIVELSQGIAGLNTILSRSQGRGSFGEMTLERMLADLFGEHTELYELQYAVEGAEKVDAAVFVNPERSQFLPVDAKFPLANAMPLLEGKGTPEIERDFARDVKARADEIAKKYVKPPKTLDFAFMFVPSEAVYYLILKNAKLHGELLQKRILPVSPNAFYAYLQSLSTAFRGMKIERKTQELQKAIGLLVKDFERFRDRFDAIQGYLDGARKSYEESLKPLERLDGKIRKIGQGEVPQAEALPIPREEGS